MRFLLLTLILVAAVTTWAAEPVYKGYPGPDRSDSEVATLQVPYEGWVGILGTDQESKRFVRVLASSYRLVKVLPGEQDIKWGWAKGDLERWRGTCARERVTLNAGHFYVLGAEPNESYRGPIPATTGMWIEDTTANEIIAGRKPPKLLEPGQVNPPATVRWLYDHPTGQVDEKGMCYDECVSMNIVAVDPVILKRREVIIEVGDQILAFPASESHTLRANLTVLAARVDELGRRTCADNFLTAKYCKRIGKHVRQVVRRIERQAEQGQLTEEDAADLISKMQALVAMIEGSE